VSIQIDTFRELQILYIMSHKCNQLHFTKSKFVSGVHLFIIKGGVEESIVNEPLISLQSKNTNNAKSGVRFKQQIRDL
jgi:hypothetical protein